MIVLGDQLKAFKCGWHLVCRWLTPLQLGGREEVGRADPHITAAAGPPSRHIQLLDLCASPSGVPMLLLYLLENDPNGEAPLPYGQGLVSF